MRRSTYILILILFAAMACLLAAAAHAGANPPRVGPTLASLRPAAVVLRTPANLPTGFLL